MARIFISFLGLGTHDKEKPETLKCGYRPCVYIMEPGARIAHETAFAQVAEIELLGPSAFDVVLILCTRKDHAGIREGSFEKHYDKLSGELVELGVAAEKIHPCFISAATSAEIQWEWFETVLEKISDNDHVVFDMTHGFRSVQIVLSASIGFLKRAKNVTVEHVFYGSVEQKGTIVDMKEFYEINDWADSVGRLVDDADARKLAQLAGTSDVPALSCLNDNELINAFQVMTDCIRNVDVNNISTTVSSALDKVRKAYDRTTGSARLLLELVEKKFVGLAFDYPLSGRYDRGYFTVQTRIIRTLLEHQLYMQAFTAMRECVASLGMVHLPVKYTTAMTTKDGRSHRHRFAEIFVNMLQYEEESWKFDTEQGEIPRDADTLRPWYAECKRLGVEPLLRSFIREMTAYRNGFDHAWTSKKQALPDIKQKAEEFIGKIETVLRLLEEKNAI